MSRYMFLKTHTDSKDSQNASNSYSIILHPEHLQGRHLHKHRMKDKHQRLFHICRRPQR